MESGGYKPKEGVAHVVRMGQDKAFDFFFRQYYTSLCFFANSIIHNENEAKDLVQDCFAKLWKDDAIKDRMDTVKSFLYTMVHNRCIDYLRKKKVILKAGLNLQQNESDSDYFDELAFAEMMRQILDRIEELPVTMKKILKMYYLEGKRYKDIANTLDTSPDAVRMQKVRAIKMIRRKLFLFLSHFLLV